MGKSRMLRRLVLLGVAAVSFGNLGRARGQNPPHDFTFSTRAYVDLNSYSRFYLQGENEWHVTDGRRSWRASGAVDFLLRPILKPIIKTPDIGRDDYLLVRVGSVYVGKWGDRSGHNAEGFLSLLGRLPLPGNWEIADRNRLDIRSKGGVSWRYRTRPVVDWSWKGGGLTLQPYTQAEFFYDSRYAQVARINWNSGIDIGRGRRMQLEPSFTRRWDQQPGGRQYTSYHLRVYWYF